MKLIDQLIILKNSLLNMINSDLITGKKTC
jgi:hypothetical protein